MTTPRRLDRGQTVWRIGDPDGQFRIFSDAGARRFGGRWHQAGDPVIYASEHFSTAMLEKLVHFAGRLPRNQHVIDISLPAGLSYEVFADHLAPDWRAAGSAGALSFGHGWASQQRSAVLFVPSAIAPVERNVLINTAHPEFPSILAGLETPIGWDDRLFGPARA